MDPRVWPLALLLLAMPSAALAVAAAQEPVYATGSE
jgi:hypothetical protein